MTTSGAPPPLRCSVTPPVCGAQSVAPIPPASCEFPDGAHHPFAAAYIDVVRSASLRARAALVNRPTTIHKVYG